MVEMCYIFSGTHLFKPRGTVDIAPFSMTSLHEIKSMKMKEM